MRRGADRTSMVARWPASATEESFAWEERILITYQAQLPVARPRWHAVRRLRGDLAAGLTVVMPASATFRPRPAIVSAPGLSLVRNQEKNYLFMGSAAGGKQARQGRLDHLYPHRDGQDERPRPSGMAHRGAPSHPRAPKQPHRRVAALELQPRQRPIRRSLRGRARRTILSRSLVRGGEARARSEGCAEGRWENRAAMMRVLRRGANCVSLREMSCRSEWRIGDA